MKKLEANSDCSMVEKSVEAFSTRFIFCVGLFSLGLGYVLTKLGLFYFSYNWAAENSTRYHYSRKFESLYEFHGELIPLIRSAVIQVPKLEIIIMLILV